MDDPLSTYRTANATAESMAEAAGTMIHDNPEAAAALAAAAQAQATLALAAATLAATGIKP